MVDLKEKVRALPDTPGVYLMKDRLGRIIYVGKAKSLRSRLSNYFQTNLPPRTAQMVATAETVEWIQVRNEVEALMLEYNLIQRHRPRFNVRLVDDKSYPFLAVTVSDEWPRPMVMRGARRKGVRYFGPFGSAYAIRETLDLLLRTFPIRTCTDNKFGHHQRLGRPCLLFHIEKCSGPCVGEVTPERYREHLADLLQFLEGDTDEVVRRLIQTFHFPPFVRFAHQTQIAGDGPERQPRSAVGLQVAAAEFNDPTFDPIPGVLAFTHVRQSDTKREHCSCFTATRVRSLIREHCSYFSHSPEGRP